MRLIRLAAIASLLVLAAVPFAPAGNALAATQAVLVQGFAFSPAALTVQLGDTVTWTNRDTVAHTVTANGGAFDKPLPAGGTVSVTFSQPGVFAYHCSIHPSMQGTITVAATATAPPTAAPTAAPTIAPAPVPTAAPPAPAAATASPASTAPSPTATSTASPTVTPALNAEPTASAPPASPSGGSGGALLGAGVIIALLIAVGIVIWRRRARIA